MAEKLYLPPPVTLINGRKFWKRKQAREYIATLCGQKITDQRPDDDYLIGSRELREMLGGVSDMWLLRHTRREDKTRKNRAAPQAAA